MSEKPNEILRIAVQAGQSKDPPKQQTQSVEECGESPILRNFKEARKLGWGERK